ncbi:54S ribosomal protein L3 mitochondrial [Dispira simplex]|nr:54S ribosomal protein L3 mitochondrial [Dispira simplex]
MNPARLFTRVPRFLPRVASFAHPLPKVGALSNVRSLHQYSVTRQATPQDTTPDNPTTENVPTAEEGTATLSPATIAFAARLGLKFQDPTVLTQALTHCSYQKGRTVNHGRFRWLGCQVIGLFVKEYFFSKYPNLSAATLENLYDIHFGPYALGLVGKELGLAYVMRWNPPVPEKEEVGRERAMGHTMQALVGAIYQEKGAATAKRFVHAFLLSRSFSVELAMNLEKPKLKLIALTKLKNMAHPVARLLKETGRLTNSPVYIVGMFSGTRKIGEGFGSSIKMAEVRACKDALIRYHLRELKDFVLPSEAEELGSEDDITFFAPKKQPTPTETTA